MLWMVSTTGVHIVLLLAILTSFTTFSPSYLHINQASHTTPVIVLATVTAVLILFQVTVFIVTLLPVREQRLCKTLKLLYCVVVVQHYASGFHSVSIIVEFFNFQLQQIHGFSTLIPDYTLVQKDHLLRYRELNLKPII